MRLPINGFLLGLIISIGAACVFPEVGAHGGILKSEVTTKLGVIAIFFLQGILLPTEKLKRAILEWRLHLFIQTFNFIIVPLLALLVVTLFSEYIKPDLRIGILFLSILPTTISTAVLFSSLAGGNIGGAIFNTSLSNIIGVFIVPIWTAWLLSGASEQSIEVAPLLIKIVLLILLPMLVGQSFRPFMRNQAQTHKKGIGRFNMGMIFYMLYVAFCDSVKSGIWFDQGFSIVISAVTISFVLLLMVKSLVFVIIKVFKFNYSSAVTAFFCASQKTLAAGVPMGTSIFTTINNTIPELGVVLLPLMCYHSFQILIGGFIISRIKENSTPK